MTELDFIQALHNKTSRDYLARVNSHDKAACAEIASQFGRDYWDGERHLGYGGYRYDGRWRNVAEHMAAHYGLTEKSRILDVGCGKGYLLYEFTQLLPGIEVFGLDVSDYAIKNAKPEIRENLIQGTAASLPWPEGHFDLVISLTTLHNLYAFDLHKALGEIERVSKGHSYLVVEAYRSEAEKANLLYWQLTCRAFHTPDEWRWIYEQAGYKGDYGFIYFE